MCVGKAKCLFQQPEVRYLGFVVSADGLHVDDEKVRAIMNASVPENLQSLQSFLGMMNFCGRFIENLSSVLHPLHELLKKGAKWEWSPNCQTAFESVKNLLANSPVLVHYDPKLPLVLETDASPFGIGACLSHVMADGSQSPVFFVSRALTTAERGYSQIDREALAVVYAVRRLHQFVFGRHFVLKTDQKPLLKLFGEHEGLPSTVSARLQRWALILSRYDYTAAHIRGKDNIVADCLSRVPVLLTPEQEDACLNAMNEFCGDPCGNIPLCASDVAKATEQDPCLSKVLHRVRQGWSKNDDEELSAFFRCQHELSVESGCLLRGSRVMIPVVFRRSLLQELHSCHFGVCRMKAVARSFFWWPHLDDDIATMCAACELCQQHAKSPSKEPAHAWVYPSRPFERIHVDYAEFDRRYYFVLVDAYSKWLEIFDLGHDASTSKTISCLMQVISRFGIPDIVVSDNGPQFVRAIARTGSPGSATRLTEKMTRLK